MPSRSFLVLDCGSTTTKAVLIEEDDSKLSVRARTEAPTTVEKPVEDITLGVTMAVEQMETMVGRKLMKDGNFITPQREDEGVDFVGATCSAGGGLQILVAGVIKSMTAESAARAALGAGAIVSDVISIDDGRELYEKLTRIASIRPDMVLVSGGVDGGNVTSVVKLAEMLYAAGLRPRHGVGRIPVIFAGNRDAQSFVRDILSGVADTKMVENLRPLLETENIAPARQQIQETFMSHTMVQAPHYAQLADKMSVPVIPTPVAVGKAIEYIGESSNCRVMACDIGGATTDFFTYSEGRLMRTVSANLGMSYSICNVVAEAGIQAVQRFLPYPAEAHELSNTLANKMVRPTSLPATPAELAIEQAVARVALGLALKHHHEMNRGIRGMQRKRGLEDIFHQDPGTGPIVSSMNIDIIVGSGSVLSMAPRRSQAAAIMLDGLAPEGVTHLLLDSQFMLPQLGLISASYPEAAWRVLMDSALLRLGTVIAPVFAPCKSGTPLGKVYLLSDSGGRDEVMLRSGDLFALPCSGQTKIIVKPIGQVDVGAGPGRTYEGSTRGGAVGVILDGRGRPLPMPANEEAGIVEMLFQARALKTLSNEVLTDFARRGGLRI